MSNNVKVLLGAGAALAIPLLIQGSGALVGWLTSSGDAASGYFGGSVFALGLGGLIFLVSLVLLCFPRTLYVALGLLIGSALSGLVTFGTCTAVLTTTGL